MENFDKVDVMSLKFLSGGRSVVRRHGRSGNIVIVAVDVELYYGGSGSYIDYVIFVGGNVCDLLDEVVRRAS